MQNFWQVRRWKHVLHPVIRSDVAPWVGRNPAPLNWCRIYFIQGKRSRMKYVIWEDPICRKNMVSCECSSSLVKNWVIWWITWKDRDAIDKKGTWDENQRGNDIMKNSWRMWPTYISITYQSSLDSLKGPFRQTRTTAASEIELLGSFCARKEIKESLRFKKMITL